MAPDRFLELGPQHHEVGRPCWDVVLVGDPLLGVEPGRRGDLNDKVKNSTRMRLFGDWANNLIGSGTGPLESELPNM